MLYKESNFHKETNYLVKIEAQLHFICSRRMKIFLCKLQRTPLQMAGKRTKK